MKQEPENGYMRKLRTLCRERRRRRRKEPQKSEFFRERKRERRERQTDRVCKWSKKRIMERRRLWS